MIISFSELYKWNTCERQWYYNFGLGLVPVDKSKSLNTGIKGHDLLQAVYEAMMNGATKEEALKAVNERAMELIHGKKGLFDLTTEHINDIKAVTKAWTLIDKYIRETEFTSKVVMVEQRFLVPASLITSDPYLQDVEIGFTPDVVFERAGGFIDVEDSKFVGRAWPSKKLNRFPQLKFYELLLKRSGRKVSRTTVRFFNTQTDIISHKNYIAEPAEEENLIFDFVKYAKEIKAFREKPIPLQIFASRTMNYGACQYCSYENVCTLEAQGKDASKTMKTQFTVNDYNYAE